MEAVNKTTHTHTGAQTNTQTRTHARVNAHTDTLTHLHNPHRGVAGGGRARGTAAPGSSLKEAAHWAEN